MHEILLKAPGRGGEGDLRHSPIAKSLLNMVGAYVKQINYWDENDKSHEVSRNSLMRFVVNGINIRSLPVTINNFFCHKLALPFNLYNIRHLTKLNRIGCDLLYFSFSCGNAQYSSA